ncbi:hypothetical protein DEU56DRAFT_762601 [Suillus clintonianus]|uniref:uncharacterized protein n=1 Tax=Suillus clintonianus TaxID=1904413 RepID=UPI001B8861BF|nr:uncharacterized protein DEU56DRAFT_762601 [Suillus clintonianus]KAG2107611.1 hypothetical protein DEU56DRAFT_762601 [Suillus clintonianus]
MSLACISVRPLVISHVSHSEKRRTLPPMSGNHPKLGTLRRCTSLEWVYDTDAPSDGSIDEGRLVIRVGDDVSIFPLDERAVPSNDGSLPTMSYWYGKVMEIYWTAAKRNKTQDVWLDIQWYYRRVDLEDQDVEYVFPSWSFTEPLTVSSLSSLAACVGDYELVLSDHKSVVDMHCVEDIVRYDEGDLSQPQIPTATLYHRWNISMQFTTRRNLELQQVNIEVLLPVVQRGMMSRNTKARLPSPYNAVRFDEEFLALMTTPIRRGGHCGVVGNGILVIQVRALMEQAVKVGTLPDGWMDDLRPTVQTSPNEIIRRYSCPTCKGMMVFLGLQNVRYNAIYCRFSGPHQC